MLQTIRAFVAVPLPAPLRGELGRIQKQLERQVPRGSVRWVRPEGIHLTLKFLGDTLVDKVPQVEAALAAVARVAPPFDFSAGGVGCFPSLHRPRVVWVGLQEGSARLAALQAAVEEAMEVAGYPREGRPFSPHLTLGRINQHAPRSDAARVGEIVGASEIGELGRVRAGSFELIQSVLKPTGAQYTTLRSFTLSG